MSTTPAVTLARRPDGTPRPDDFAVTDLPVGEPGPDEVLIAVSELSLDPYLRSLLGPGHLDEPAVPLGGVVPGRAIGRVMTSRSASVTAGTWVLAETGWRGRAVVPAASVRPFTVPDDVPRSAVLGALGMPGLTAYAALERHLVPQAGETVVVSAATGGVGSVAGALIAAGGADPVAIVGTAEKAKDAVDALGYRAAVVRTAPDWEAQLAEACPDGIDGYLHLADQPTLTGVVKQLAVGARVSLCGLMDQYNDGPRTVLDAGAVMTARAVVHGMVVYDHGDLAAAHAAKVGELLARGDLVLHEERHAGLHRAPEAFARLMSGANRGKVVVEVTA